MESGYRFQPDADREDFGTIRLVYATSACLACKDQSLTLRWAEVIPSISLSVFKSDHISPKSTPLFPDLLAGMSAAIVCSVSSARVGAALFFALIWRQYQPCPHITTLH